MIPRIFHRIWLGGKPLPECFLQWGESWLRHHPGWTMKLWREAEAAKLECSDLLPRCTSYPQQADLVRYEVLAKEGGVYLDTDMECFRNIEGLIGDLDFFGFWQKDGIISNALFGCVQGYPLLIELWKRSRSEFTSAPWNAMGPPFFTRIVSQYPHEKVFPRKTFTPFTYDEYSKFPQKPMKFTQAPEGSYAINHRGHLWYEDSNKLLVKES